ncbi:MerR family transcriptional regulator [Embleya sp. NPDC059259]|uniref:helix-turn-helix domain-containing protein n=1 Tax=unclassified Embleya TaxID=2699296 RepID=UPI003679FB6D
MNGHTLYSIGELARRTGATVKTVRFYSDCGLLPPVDRSPAGYRRYDDGAVARLDLVRTLRDLGLDLAAIRKVVDRELALSEVAAAHAEALEVQIRILRLRRAVLSAVATRGATLEETHLMHRLATLSEAERRRLIDEFLHAAFADVRNAPMFAGIMRSMTPELPDNPEVEQVRAWVELAELSQDPDFRVRMQRMVQDEAATHTEGAPPTPHNTLAAIVRDRIAPVVAGGVEPTSPQADEIVSTLVTRCAHLLDARDDAESRRRLLSRLEHIDDPRRERYLALLATINGWPAPQSLHPVLDWSIRALRARTGSDETGTELGLR